MARPVAERALPELGLRVLSAAVLAPAALAAAYFGYPYFTVLVGAFALVMALEWAHVCEGGKLGPRGSAVVGLVAVLLLAGAAFGPAQGLLWAAPAAAAAYVAARVRGGRDAHWFAFGVLYIAVPALSLLWLRADPAFGRAPVLWLFAVVWAVDIGAYGCGRLIGGPKLAPRISPAKTWAGAAGGVAAAVLVSVAAAGPMQADPGRLAALAAALAIAAELGDLLESAIKRRFGVKDMSHVIPGHGGALDRVDGMLAAAPAAALLVLFGAWRPWA